MQINCDGEPLQAKKFLFKVLPKRLRIHMPETNLLAASSDRLERQQKAFKHKVAHATKRPVRKGQKLWQKPVVQSSLKYTAAVGMGVALTLATQRLRARRASAQP